MIAILSDIHGNLPALQRVLEDAASQGMTRVVSLGDVSGYYPFINEVIELLRRYDTINLIGNHDRYIIDDSECPRSRSANLALSYQKKVIDEDSKAWLRQSVPTLRIGEASFVHGGWNDPEDEYLYKISSSYFERLEGTYFFCGHTHVQCMYRFANGRVFVNPGSVGQPRDGDVRAAYALYDPQSGEVLLRRVAYDIDRVASKMQALGFEPYMYENLYKGSRIGGRIDTISIEA